MGFLPLTCLVSPNEQSLGSQEGSVATHTSLLTPWRSQIKQTHTALSSQAPSPPEPSSPHPVLCWLDSPAPSPATQTYPGRPFSMLWCPRDSRMTKGTCYFSRRTPPTCQSLSSTSSLRTDTSSWKPHAAFIPIHTLGLSPVRKDSLYPQSH